MRLIVNSNYSNQKHSFIKGAEIEVTAEEADFFFRDAPGCFAPVDEGEPEEKSVEIAPVDKMVHTSKNKAGRK